MLSHTSSDPQTLPQTDLLQLPPSLTPIPFISQQVSTPFNFSLPYPYSCILLSFPLCLPPRLPSSFHYPSSIVFALFLPPLPLRFFPFVFFPLSPSSFFAAAFPPPSLYAATSLLFALCSRLSTSFGLCLDLFLPGSLLPPLLVPSPSLPPPTCSHHFHSKRPSHATSPFPYDHCKAAPFFSSPCFSALYCLASSRFPIIPSSLFHRSFVSFKVGVYALDL